MLDRKKNGGDPIDLIIEARTTKQYQPLPLTTTHGLKTKKCFGGGGLGGGIFSKKSPPRFFCFVITSSAML